jgi:hypothetical protein
VTGQVGDRPSLLPTALLLALLVAALLHVQLVVFPGVKIEAAARELPGTPGSLIAVLRDPLRAAWLLPLALAFLAFLGLAALELRHHGLARILNRLVASRRGAVLGLLALVAILTRYYLDPGVPGQFDAKLHTMQTGELVRQVADGSLPDWSFTWYAGYPFLRYRAPLFYLLAGGPSLLLDSVFLGMKITLWVVHLLSAWAVFALARELGADRRGAFLAGLAAAISFQHTHATVLAGRMPVSLLYLWFPLLLRDVERMVRRPTHLLGLRIGLWVALLVTTHPALSTYAVLAAAVFGLVRILAGDRPVPTLGRLVVRLTAGVAFSGLLVAGLVVPALIEMRQYQVADMYSGGGIGLSLLPDFGAIRQILAWSNTFRHTSLTYVGLVVVLLFVAALLRRAGIPAIRAALGLTAGLLVLLLGSGYFGSRSVHFLVPVLAAGVGLAGTRFGPRAFPWLVLLLLADLGPTTVQSPFRPDLDYDVRFLRRAAERCGGERAVRVSLRDGRYALTEWAAIYDSGQPVVGGPFREAAGPMYPHMLRLLDRIGNDLNGSGALSAPSHYGLRMLGCRYLLFEDGHRPVIPPLADRRLVADEAVPALRVTGAGPAVAVLDGGAFDRFAARSHPDWAAAFRAAPPELADPARAGVTGRILAYAPKHVRITVDSTRHGVLLLAFSHLPGLTVSVDGRPARTRAGPFGMTGVDVTPGEHRIDLAFEAPAHLSLWRAVSFLTAAVAVLGGILLLLVRRARHRTRQ